MNGVELWRGPSRLDGGPIVAIATWGSSRNPKTGDMVQTWILRADQRPGEAKRAGADASICGDCIHREGSCYVNVAWGPTRVWSAWRDGGYPALTPATAAALRELPLRIGSYGDPAAVPGRVWRRIRGERSTGYTHAWRQPWARGMARYLMASCESLAEAEEAKQRGWRPFLVVALNRPLPDGFAWCPSDALNPGRKVACGDCGACSGTRGGSKPIAIYAHGAGATGFGAGRRAERLPMHEAKHASNYDPLVRLGPKLHAAVKAQAKREGVPMRRWVESVLGGYLEGA